MDFFEYRDVFGRRAFDVDEQECLIGLR